MPDGACLHARCHGVTSSALQSRWEIFEARTCSEACTWEEWKPSRVCIDASCAIANDDNINAMFEAQAGQFELTWSVTPQTQELDAAIGTRRGAGVSGIGFATSVRFGVSA